MLGPIESVVVVEARAIVHAQMQVRLVVVIVVAVLNVCCTMRVIVCIKAALGSAFCVIGSFIFF